MVSTANSAASRPPRRHVVFLHLLVDLISWWQHANNLASYEQQERLPNRAILFPLASSFSFEPSSSQRRHPCGLLAPPSSPPSVTAIFHSFCHPTRGPVVLIYTGNCIIVLEDGKGKEGYWWSVTEPKVDRSYHQIDRCIGDDEAWRQTAPGSQKCCLERHEQAVLDSV
nr:hypothetical protein Iba_chr01eCG3120 [Ipomoea batatas]